jgi:hypothetical protein
VTEPQQPVLGMPPYGGPPPGPVGQPFPPVMPPPHTSGLFPGQPLRPFYREPHPVGAGPMLLGVAVTVIWLALFGALGDGLNSYTWWTLTGALGAWAVAVVLTLSGDRGVATGVAITAGFGLSVAVGFVAARWITTYNWPLW